MIENKNQRDEEIRSKYYTEHKSISELSKEYNLRPTTVRTIVYNRKRGNVAKLEEENKQLKNQDQKLDEIKALLEENRKSIQSIALLMRR